MDDSRSQRRYFLEVESLLISVRSHFDFINQADDFLTDQEKKHLKEYYLETFVTPRGRQLLEQYFPEEFSPTEEAQASTQNKRD